MNNLTLGLAQIDPKLGDVKANIQRHLEIIDEAADRDVQLLIFPELSLTGYVLQDLVYEVAMTVDSDKLQPIREASRNHGLDVMFGFVDVDRRGRYFIAAAYISSGEILHVHHKIYLPTYGLFDEGRFFAPGENIRAFDTPFGRVGMLICEDFWHASPNYVLWMDGADLLLFHSASPGRGVTESESMASARWVQLVNQSYGSLFTNYVVHCNRVGYEGGLAFWGGSTVVDPDGEFSLKAPYFQEEVLAHEIDLNQLRRTRSRLPLLRDERLDLTVRELERISQTE